MESSEKYVPQDVYEMAMRRIEQLTELLELTTIEAQGGCACPNCKLVRQKLAELEGYKLETWEKPDETSG